MLSANKSVVNTHQDLKAGLTYGEDASTAHRAGIKHCIFDG